MRRLLTLSLALVLTPIFLAADWPNYRGPAHDGTAPAATVSSGAPKILWKIPMGAGFSSIAVAGERAYCFADVNDKETCLALDRATGKGLWATPIDKTIHDRSGGNGPRSTPTVDGDRVYVLGAYAKLACMNAADGKILWSHDLLKEFNGSLPSRGWGSAASPLIQGEFLFACTGGSNQSLVAFNKTTGNVVWKTESDQPTHASPVPATIHEIPQIIFFTKKGLVAVTPDAGKVLWRFPFPFQTATAASPVVGGKEGDIVYCSAAYKVGAAACKVEKTPAGLSAKPLWRQENTLQQHWSSAVHKDGYLYGLYKPDRLGPESLRCIDIETGKIKWLQKGFSWRGGTTLLGDRLIVQNNNGDLAVVQAAPDAYKELSRTHAVDGQAWTMATIADTQIFARSTSQAACLDLSGR
jgi:outer membrane protein assembly factor BamB